MSQITLFTDRLRLVPLAPEHLELEIALDSDPEVMRYLTGLARTRDEVEQAHRRRLAAGLRVPGLGFWVGFVENTFVGCWLLEPPERPDQGPLEGQGLSPIYAETKAVNVASRATMSAVGLRYLRAFASELDEPLVGVEEGAVEYASTREQWSPPDAQNHRLRSR